ncbi:MAG: hypothetical protein QW478_14650 [Candidatus Micrarchaeaceae archaeon]
MDTSKKNNKTIQQIVSPFEYIYGKAKAIVYANEAIKEIDEITDFAFTSKYMLKINDQDNGIGGECIYLKKPLKSIITVNGIKNITPEVIAHEIYHIAQGEYRSIFENPYSEISLAGEGVSRANAIWHGFDEAGAYLFGVYFDKKKKKEDYTLGSLLYVLLDRSKKTIYEHKNSFLETVFDKKSPLYIISPIIISTPLVISQDEGYDIKRIFKILLSDPVEIYLRIYEDKKENVEKKIDNAIKLILRRS